MKYEKKPIIIEAEQFLKENKHIAFNFITCNKEADFDGDEEIIRIQTLEGVMIARLGDYIIKGIKGEFYPCKEDIFNATYEAIKPIEFKKLQEDGWDLHLDEEGEPVASKGGSLDNLPIDDAYKINEILIKLAKED